MVIFVTFCTLKLIIVNDIEQWHENTPRDVARYILPDQNTTIIFPSNLLVIISTTILHCSNKLDCFPVPVFVVWSSFYGTIQLENVNPKNLVES